MISLYPLERTCAACDVTSRIGSARRLPTWEPETGGVDGRPGDDACLFLDEETIEECPSCGHVAPNLAVPYPRLARAVASRRDVFAQSQHVLTAMTRAAGVAAFCRALVKAGREPIVAVFAARGMPKEQLESIAAAAEALAQAGRNVMIAAEATKRETEAVAAQRRKWQQIRRMVRKAVTGIPELEKKYAEC